MTHRSRSFAPAKHKPGPKKAKGAPKKLHQPPPRSNVANDASSDPGDEPSLVPASVFLDSPTDGEILQVIHHALRQTLDSPDFSLNVQKAKGLLYDKKWLELFGNSALLESYAGRWVPSRACCYRELFASLASVRRLFVVERGSKEDSDEEGETGDAGDEGETNAEAGPSKPTANVETLHTRILSLGGGASSELLAIAALAHSCLNLEPKLTADVKGKSPVKWSWTGVDIGAWGGIVDKFRSTLATDWDLDSGVFDVDFIQADLLKPALNRSNDADSVSPPAASTATAATGDIDALPPIDISTLFSPQPTLITILFTLTELLTQSRASTFTFLRSLTLNSKPGTLLLVADSASDLSEFEMGSSGRKWPIHMVLDTLLLGPPGARTGDWHCMRKEDSRWFRMGEGVGAGWPVKLENTRYWFRLYRRL